MSQSAYENEYEMEEYYFSETFGLIKINTGWMATVEMLELYIMHWKTK